METIIQWDKELFRFINQDLYSDAMDFLMRCASGGLFWLPLYISIVIYLVYLFRVKSLWVLLAVALLVASTDQISSQVLKKSVQRYRPCRPEAQLGFDVRLQPGAGCSEYGFVSSHASNVFGLATFFGLLFYQRSKWWLGVGLIWASVIGFSRIYLGQHYPTDVIGGAVLGILLGLIWYKFLGLVFTE
ncbi:MAG: phosphatase PAP2 family protein [Bacteroidetes bacterium]|nr:phosphatase PAP2 family protein [Bacteroidota bacterium]